MTVPKSESPESVEISTVLFSGGDTKIGPPDDDVLIGILTVRTGNSNIRFSEFSNGNSIGKVLLSKKSFDNDAYASDGYESKNAKRLLESLNKEMTPSQIEKAKDLARECVKKNYKGC